MILKMVSQLVVEVVVVVDVAVFLAVDGQFGRAKFGVSPFPEKRSKNRLSLRSSAPQFRTPNGDQQRVKIKAN